MGKVGAMLKKENVALHHLKINYFCIPSKTEKKRGIKEVYIKKILRKVSVNVLNLNKEETYEI